MQGLTSVSGLASGLNTDDIIQKLISVDQQQIQKYQTQQDSFRTQLAAFQEANTRLAAVQDAAGALATPSLFQSNNATSSNTGIVTATAGSGATPGQYVISVQSLARAHQVVSQSYADLNSTSLGSGTITITAAGQTTTIQVDSSDNTVSGLRDAINRANTNVGASIVQDGNSSYRLMIYSKQSGTANALTINSSLSGGTSPTLTDLQTAQDAKVQLGSGSNALTAVRSSNSIQDLIPGVTLNLVSEAETTPVTVTITQDTAKIKDAVQKMVDQYNNAVDYFNEQFSFDSDKKTGGTLLNSFALQSVQSDLQQVFTGSVPGVASGALSNVGVSMGDDGKLTLDAATLENKLASDPNSVMKVFALTAQTSNVGVQFVTAGDKTVIDGSSCAVNITQAARQARVTAGTAQATPLDADETLTINGVAIALTTGMTQAQVLQAINARTADTGVTAAATAADGSGTGNYLTFLSAGYGSAGAVSVVSSRASAGGGSTGVGNVAATAASAGGETGSGTGQVGLDVVGTINGEGATGRGQILTGNSGNATTDGLMLRINAMSAGSLGTVRLLDGIANAAQRTLNTANDPKNGPIQGEEDSLNQGIQDLQGVIDAQQEASKRREDDLRTKFNQLESTMAQLQSQSSYLTSQLASLH